LAARWDRLHGIGPGQTCVRRDIESKAIGALAVADASIDFVTKERLKDRLARIDRVLRMPGDGGPPHLVHLPPNIDRLDGLLTPIMSMRVAVISALTKP